VTLAQRFRRRVPRAARKSIVRWVVLALVVAGAAAFIRADQVHEYGWEWRLFPSAAPPKVEFLDRDYGRGDRRSSVPDTWVHGGDTMGGGEILAPPDDGRVPTVICVRDGRDVWFYDLMGGP
jgi:hypothetical protein